MVEQDQPWVFLFYPPTQKTPRMRGDECVGRILRSFAVKDEAKEDFHLLRRIPPTRLSARRASKVPRAVPAGLHI